MTAVSHPDAPALTQQEAAARDRQRQQRQKLLRILVPVLMLLLVLAVWHLATRNNAPDTFNFLPTPLSVAVDLYENRLNLFNSAVVTLWITLRALGLALIGGSLLAIVLAQSRWVELALSPYMVILQVTPVVAIAPLLLVYLDETSHVLLIVAFLVAFFPILSNMTTGLKSVDHNLLNLFQLYGAGWWRTLRLLKLPAAMPYFMTGLRIGGGLALIAAVVAEFAAGSAGRGSGLAFRVLESQYRLNMPRLFGVLILLALIGIAIFGATSLVSWLALRKWHESALRREN